jgi:hypothetical protein
MTPEERRLLADLAEKMAQTPAPARDAEAEEFIRKNIGSRPDALYMMTQTVLIQNMALQQAQVQIRDLQQRAAQGSGSQPGVGGSFLGQQPTAQYGAPQPQSVVQQAGPGFGQSSSAGGFLRGAAQTAAGVAAGALAFEGIRSLFSHSGFGFGGGGFGQAGLMGGVLPVEETVINNYYDSPAPHEEQGRHHLAESSDDQGSGYAQLQDADYEDSNGMDDAFSSDDSSIA